MQFSAISIIMNTTTYKILLVLKTIVHGKNIKSNATEIPEFWCQF